VAAAGRRLIIIVTLTSGVATLVRGVVLLQAA
jgi:hypothetical protein